MLSERNPETEWKRRVASVSASEGTENGWAKAPGIPGPSNALNHYSCRHHIHGPPLLHVLKAFNFPTPLRALCLQMGTEAQRGQAEQALTQRLLSLPARILDQPPSLYFGPKLDVSLHSLPRGIASPTIQES